MPLLSVVCALAGYFFSGSWWVALAGFLIAGPLLTVLIALLLTGRADDGCDNEQKFNERG
jgi:hypothetical protein